MILKNHTRIDLAQGGNIFKQGDYVELAFTPRNAAGQVVDLTGKDIQVAIWNPRKGIVYQGDASFDGAEKVIRVTINETLDYGKFQIEFTVTDSTDSEYRMKFPSDEYNGVINITPSTDNMDVVGVQMTTVAQLRNEQTQLQQEFASQVLPRVDTVEGKQTQLEADYQAAAGALTEDSEVILARKGEPTLRAFNDKITTQLAETGEVLQGKASYDDSIIKLLHGHCALRNEVLVKVRENAFIDIGVYYSENKIAQYTMKPDGDGWYRLRDVVLKDLSTLNDGEIIDEVMASDDLHKNFDSTTGTWILTSPISSTTQVGATFTATFTGTGFYFSSFMDDRGGIWEFAVDGEVVKTISVWSATQVSNNRQEIVRGLTDAEHTIVATFKGDDPEHLPRDGAGTSRGWVNNNTTGSTSHKTIAPIVAVYADSTSGLDLPVKQQDSRQEFAFQVSPSEAQTNYVWVPEHGVFGVMKDLSYKILFGGKEVENLASESNSFVSVPYVKIITRYNAYYPGDSSPLWKGRIDQTINGQGFHVSGKMDFLRDTYIRIAYPGMWAASKQHTDNDRVVTSKSKRYSLPKNVNDGSNVTLTDVPSGVAHFTKESANANARNAVAAVELHDYSRALRLGEEGSHPNPVRVDLRTDGQRKTYMTSHRQTTVPAGETFSFNSRYFACEVDEAAEILP